MWASMSCKLMPFMFKKVAFNTFTRHYALFRSGSSSDSNAANNLKVRVCFAPEMIPDEPSDNPALILPKGEQLTIPFNDITPVGSLRAFIKNVTQFDLVLESIFSDADKLSPQQIMEKIDSALVQMRYSLNLAHVLTQAYPADYKFGVLDDMYHSYMKHDIGRFNPLVYHSACDIIESTQGTKDVTRLLAQFYRSHGKLYGYDKSPTAQEEIAEYYACLQTHVNRFISSTNSSIRNEAVIISDENVLKALPETFAAKFFNKSSIRLPLHPVVYETFMAYCPDKMTRKRVWIAYNSKPQVQEKVNNSVEFEKARDYRHRLANLAGHINYAEMAISRKMAGSAKVVINMLNSLNERMTDKYNQDLSEIGEKSRHNIGKMELWDIPYLKNVSLNKKFGAKVDVTRYFPLDKVISGTFQLVENIFDVKIELATSDKIQLWSQHVKFYRIVDCSSGQILGHFYFDPFCQQADRYGSNIIELTNRSKKLETTPLIASFLSKRFPIVKDQQILLSYPEYLSFLSMIGRILTIVMPKKDYYELSTVYNTSLDCLDSFGHAMLLYGLYNHKAVQLCSSNITNGEPLPEQNHTLLRQYVLAYESIGLKNDLFLSAFDLACYINTEFWREIIPEVWKKYYPDVELPREYAYPTSFNEIVSNEGASCYYSKIWSQMIGSDICSALMEGEASGQLKQVGKKLRNTVLSTNLSLETAELFREFRGRDPSISPYLQLHNLTDQPAITES